MSASILHHDTLLRGHFPTGDPYIMSSPHPVPSRDVSYDSHSEITQTASPAPLERPLILPERRSTVHFDDGTAPNEVAETTAPVDKTAIAGSKLRATGNNRSTSRSATTAVTSTKATPSSLKVYENMELTAVDKKWGCLFDVDGQPTERFREAMHSLSRYIIRAFPSSENIVLVPAKLASFYNFHGVSCDPFRYQFIFQSGDRDANRKIADLYQDLGCSYHLVQASPASQPRIPGLTPDGFTRWMALHLQAFPDRVARRIDRVISDFPLDVVNALDGKSERMPKQLSRCLLPQVPDGHIRSLLQQAVRRHFGEEALSPLSLPSDKNNRTTSYMSQSCPPSPALPTFPPSSESSSSSSHLQRRDASRLEQKHRESDPGATLANNEKSRSPLSPSHHRHASFPGQPPVSHGGTTELVRDRRSQRERDGRRDASLGRPRSSRHDTEHDALILAEGNNSDYSPLHRQHAHRDYDHHSHDGNSRQRSLRQPRLLSKSSTSITSATGGSDNRRGQYSPSPLSTIHSGCTQDANNAIRDGSRSTMTTKTSARRAASPKPRSFRVSLPEIHHTGTRRQYTAHEEDVPRDTRNHNAAMGRRSSYCGTPVRESADELPSSRGEDHGRDRDSGRHRGDTKEDGRRPNTRDHRYKVEGRGREERGYRLYGSSLPTSPLSASPVLQYSSPRAALREEAGRRPSTATSTATEAASVAATYTSEIVGVQPQAQVDMPIPPSPSSPRRPPLRTAVSLSAALATVENEKGLYDDPGSDSSDQTWDEYLRASPSLTPVA